MNGASATITVGELSETFDSSRTGHAEINGLNSFYQRGKLDRKDVHISNITGKFTSGNKPVGMCTNCRSNIFDILAKGKARSVSFPKTQGNKILGMIKIDSADFSKVRTELDKIRSGKGTDRQKSDAVWEVLEKYNKLGNNNGKC